MASGGIGMAWRGWGKLESEEYQTVLSIPTAPTHTLGVHLISTDYTWSISNLRYTCLGWVDLLYPVPLQATPCHQKSPSRISTSYLLSICGQFQAASRLPNTSKCCCSAGNFSYMPMLSILVYSNSNFLFSE